MHSTRKLRNNMKKRLFEKQILLVIFGISVISIFSVGFSSFIVTNSVSTNYFEIDIGSINTETDTYLSEIGINVDRNKLYTIDYYVDETNSNVIFTNKNFGFTLDVSIYDCSDKSIYENTIYTLPFLENTYLRIDLEILENSNNNGVINTRKIDVNRAITDVSLFPVDFENNKRKFEKSTDDTGTYFYIPFKSLKCESLYQIALINNKFSCYDFDNSFSEVIVNFTIDETLFPQLGKENAYYTYNLNVTYWENIL